MKVPVLKMVGQLETAVACLDCRICSAAKGNW